MANVTYNPNIFRVPDMEAAKRIILTPEGSTTEARWASETPYLAELIAGKLDLRAGQTVVDYGCGIGRMAKALIERCGCHVLGVDMSQEMRGLAPAYVDSPNFSAVSNLVFIALMKGGLRVDAAISVWVLQHCLTPDRDIALIRAALRPGAPLGVVNTKRRCVPTVEKPWANDGIDLRKLLSESFIEREVCELDAAFVGESTARSSFWGVYGKAP
ncbi:MAG: class I SAM-dependent methyltransferase [Phenylobacterium sp.]